MDHTPIELVSEKNSDRLKEITDRLQEGITDLFDSERYKEYLRVMARFHRYSFQNTILIAMQKPDATRLAGFHAWKNFGRHVKKGEKGIKVIAPTPYKKTIEVEKVDPHSMKLVYGSDGKPVKEKKEVMVPYYKVTTTFDVSQTEGRPLPSIVNSLAGNVDRYERFMAVLEKVSPVPVSYEDISGRAHGYYDLQEKRIVIRDGMSQQQTVKTLIHEISHAKLHDFDLKVPKDKRPEIDRETMECQAEAVAFVCCERFGLDSSDYSFGYIAGWSSGRELKEL